MGTVWPRWMLGRMVMAMLDHESNKWIKNDDHSQKHQTSCQCCEIPLHRNFVISYWNLVCTRQLKQSNPLSLMKQQYSIIILNIFFLLFLQLGWLAWVVWVAHDDVSWTVFLQPSSFPDTDLFFFFNLNWKYQSRLHALFHFSSISIAFNKFNK